LQKNKLWHEKATAAPSVALQTGETDAELWYPIAKRSFETVVISSSILSLIFYYTQKISKWGYVFRQCKISDAFFLARSNHYELRSDEYRRKQASVRKKEHEERYKDDVANAAYDEPIIIGITT